MHSGPFTLDELRETIRRMKDLHSEGQGGLHNAMCRLSLPMSHYLLDEVVRLRSELELRTSAPLHETKASLENAKLLLEMCELRTELKTTQNKLLEWQEGCAQLDNELAAAKETIVDLEHYRECCSCADYVVEVHALRKLLKRVCPVLVDLLADDDIEGDGFDAAEAAVLLTNIEDAIEEK